MDRMNRGQWLRNWAPTSERGWQRLAVTGALAAAVTASGWAWAVPSTATPTAYADDMGHGAGQGMSMTGTMAPADQMQMTNSPAASLRVGLNRLLSEHVYLAARATGAALGNRQPEFEAAAAALDQNSVDLSKAIGSAYGPEAEAAFLPLWRSHIGMVVEYTQGKAANDQAMQDKAVNDLLGYTNDFAAFLSGANENLPKDVVQMLVKDHALSLKEVVDAQADGDQMRQFMAIRTAGAHMGMIADPLAEATAAKFPEKFGGMASAPSMVPGPQQSASAAQMLAQMPAEIRQFAYRPAPLEVPAGTTVTWTNRDQVEHSVTAADGSFDSGLFTQGGTYTFTFDAPGTYAYLCSRHASMRGEVSVV